VMPGGFLLRHSGQDTPVLATPGLWLHESGERWPLSESVSRFYGIVMHVLTRRRDRCHSCRVRLTMV
jgi:hypothetical protein